MPRTRRSSARHRYGGGAPQTSCMKAQRKSPYGSCLARRAKAVKMAGCLMPQLRQSRLATSRCQGKTASLRGLSTGVKQPSLGLVGSHSLPFFHTSDTRSRSQAAGFCTPDTLCILRNRLLTWLTRPQYAPIELKWWQKIPKTYPGFNGLFGQMLTGRSPENREWQ